jgi:hypothetical protein
MNNPDGPLGFWLSIIPFTSPVAMIARIPLEFLHGRLLYLLPYCWEQPFYDIPGRKNLPCRNFDVRK